MALELAQIKDILKSPSKRSVIFRAAELEKRTRFHTDENMSSSDAGCPVTSFLSWVSSFLPRDKYSIFCQLFRFPLTTPSVVEDVYRELERVFYSRNASSTYQFSDTELLEDWLGYRRERLHEPDIWRTEGWRQTRVSFNSVLVVDLPAVQETERPEPYFYWLGIENVIDFEMQGDSGFKWLVFKQPDNRIAVFDDTSIRVFQLDNKGDIVSLVTESLHGLGYCPARFFWSSRLNEKNKEIRRNPITKELSNLDWYLFFSLSKRHLDLYAPYPIYSAYETECDYEDSETGNYCDHGFLRDVNGEYRIAPDGSLERCPLCKERRLTGPGTVVDVPAPNVVEGVVDMRNPVQITTIDSDSLQYNVDECRRLKDEIITSVVGSGGTVSEKEAINETQVAANFESKTSVLNSLKTNFEEAQRFVEETICRLRYGSGFLSLSVSWGTEFYVFTSKELYAKYEDAKRAGLSVSELDAISQQIMEVEYMNNPLSLQRMALLKQLEPYPHKTFAEVMTMAKSGFCSREDLLIKLNFIGLIDRFERENINIIEFASALTLREKVKLITDKLKDYVKEIKTYRPDVSAVPSGGTAGSDGEEGGAGSD